MKTRRPSWLRPGRWLYQTWYRPLGWFERSWREGGPVQQWRTSQGRQEMRRAALDLPPRAVRAPIDGEPALVFLTGAGYWEQTVFCLGSLLEATPGRTWPAFAIDDGTLTPTGQGALESAFPGLAIHGIAKLETALDRRLPKTSFPTLRAHRETFVLLRKLTDAHAVRPGWNLLLDADMLFYERPEELLAWWNHPTSPIVLTDLADAYGYPSPILSKMAGHTIPPRVNTGLCGVERADVDWHALEFYAASLLRTHGSSYFLEQALTALALSGKAFVQLPEHRYRVKPAPIEIDVPTAALHHYVAESKRSFFRHAWRRFAPPGVQKHGTG